MSCFEDNLNTNNQNKSTNLFGQATDSNAALFENLMGSVILGLGVGMFMGTALVRTLPFVCGALMVGGLLLLADSHGILTCTASSSDIASFVVDVALSCFGAGLTSRVSTVATNAFTSTIPMGEQTVISISESVQRYKVLNAIKTTAQTCIDTARDLIISYEVKNTINDITGWGLT